MNAPKPYLDILESETRRLKEEFNDRRVLFCRNVKGRRFDVWYKPDSGRPYRVCSPVNVGHAIKLLRDKLKYAHLTGRDLCRLVDCHNERILAAQRRDACEEVRSQMRHPTRRHYANV